MAKARCVLLTVAAILLAGCEPAAQSAPARAAPVKTGEGFDFYVLSLSWSPSYCAAEGPRANRQQCGSGRDHGFVVHGLWPQFERGYPQHCASREPERVPDSLVRRYLDLMPSAGLIGHQWRKHGSCSGLSQADYFSVVRAAAERVRIPDLFDRVRADRDVDPDAIEASFLSANRGMPADGIAVTCEAGHMREVRICLGKELEFRSCAEIDRGACRAPSVELPAR